MQQGMLSCYGNRFNIENKVNSAFSVPQTLQSSKSDIKLRSIRFLANYEVIFLPFVVNKIINKGYKL